MQQLGASYGNITIPTTARDWELFTTKKGVGVAARAMTSALKKALKGMPTMLKKMNKEHGAEGLVKVYARALGAVKKKYIDPVAFKYSAMGASDSEPTRAAQQALIDFAKMAIYGATDEYHPELGDWM